MLIPKYSHFPEGKEKILSGDPEQLYDYLRKLLIELEKEHRSIYQMSKDVGSSVSSVKQISSSYTCTDSDRVLLIDASGGAVSVYLPSAGQVRNKLFTVVKIDSSGNAVTLTPAGSETINGSSSKSLSAQWDKTEVVSDGSNWVEV